MLAAFLTTVLWAVSAITAHRSIRHLGPNLANLARLAVATVVLAAVAHTVGGGLAGAGLGWLFVSGLIGFGIGDVGNFQALPRLGSRLTILFSQCGAVPIAGLAEWWWLGVPLSGPQIGLSACIIGGLCFALAPGAGLKIALRDLLVGSAWGVVAAAGQGLGAVCSRVAYDSYRAAGEPADGVVVGLTAAYQRILGGLLVAVGVVLLERWWRARRAGVLPANVAAGAAARAAAADAPAGTGASALAQRTRTPWPARPRTVAGWVVANALAGPVVGATCYQWALSEQPSAVVLPIVALTPIVVIPLAMLSEGERPSARSLVGGALAVAAAVVLALTS